MAPEHPGEFGALGVRVPWNYFSSGLWWVPKPIGGSGLLISPPSTRTERRTQHEDAPAAHLTMFRLGGSQQLQIDVRSPLSMYISRFFSWPREVTT